MLKIAIIVAAVPFLFNAGEATAQSGQRYKLIQGTGGPHGPSGGGAQGNPGRCPPGTCARDGSSRAKNVAYCQASNCKK
jgi:hypothetical protein